MFLVVLIGRGLFAALISRVEGDREQVETWRKCFLRAVSYIELLLVV